MKINSVLASLVDIVQQEIGKINKLFGWLDKSLGNLDEGIVNFSMTQARDDAWEFAEKLARTAPEQQAEVMKQRDAEMAVLAQKVKNPGKWIGFIIMLIKLNEKKAVAHNIKVLNEPANNH